MSERYYPDDIMYQKKQVSNRTLLMNIDESNIQNNEERVFVQKYKQIFQQLEETNATRYEQQLRKLEEKEIFRSLVDREREKLRIKREIEGRLALERLREKEAIELEETINRIRKQREENRIRKQLEENLLKQEQKSQIETPIQAKETYHKTGNSSKTNSIKERLTASLGFFGGVLYFLIRIIVYILPFVMIGGNFFVTLVLVGINTLVPFASVVFWIWGLVCAITGVQDIWAIMYYIVFVIVWIPFYIDSIISIISFIRRK